MQPVLTQLHTSTEQAYLDALRNGYRPTVEHMREVCTALHAIMVDHDYPEMLWMDRNLEDMADTLTTAIENAKLPVELPDTWWIARQDRAAP